MTEGSGGRRTVAVTAGANESSLSRIPAYALKDVQDAVLMPPVLDAASDAPRSSLTTVGRSRSTAAAACGCWPRWAGTHHRRGR